MYERLNKSKIKMNINKSYINNNRFSFFNYTNGKKHLNSLNDKRIRINYFNCNNINSYKKKILYSLNKSKKQNFNYLNNNSSNFDFFFTKIKNKNNFNDNKKIQSDIYLKTYTNFRKKNKIDNNNNTINCFINNLHKEIVSNKKNFFDYKLLDYKIKSKTMKFSDKRNKSFEYKKNIINNDYLRTLNNYKKNNNITFLRNKTNNYFNNFTTTINLTNPFKNKNNNFIITQNNTNNYFIFNYNNKKKDNLNFSIFNKKNDNIKKQKEEEEDENSIDFNNIDDSTILNI